MKKVYILLLVKGFAPEIWKVSTSYQSIIKEVDNLFDYYQGIYKNNPVKIEESKTMIIFDTGDPGWTRWHIQIIEKEVND